ncbi:MAG TPA: LacI family DNA-binding transcriptional regulator, partial [Microbacterium sp.]|nr:LacI family DNA-binding transcriptional regulator [Microbacterium sp.]
MQKRPTSRDVARLAGVSQSTVSFVYTGRDGVAPATRDRVLQAASELNYRPNLAARAMRTQRT